MTKCPCKTPAVANMDHVTYDPESRTSTPMVSRVCTKCWTHWYGRPDQVRQYTRKEWDQWIGQTFDVPNVT